MIDTIKKVIETKHDFEKLNDELAKFYDVVVTGDDSIQYLQLGRFIADSENMEVLYESRGGLGYPHKYVFEHLGIEFFIIISNKDNERYKKATASTVAK